MSLKPESTQRPSERALVAALVTPNSEVSSASDPLAEIVGLAEAAGASVAGSVIQRVTAPNPRTAFGSGKVEEIRERCEQVDAQVVVVDFDLSPSQGRNLEKELDRRVVDRTELILDIFANRARTRQAKLQVELAQLEYLRTRLRRMWTHLERTEGAIGARGPGETQLESDRRMVDKKISDLKRRLGEIEARRQREAASRDDRITLSLVGYTNAGKSSLMRRLTGAEVRVADQLFATLDTRVRSWTLGDGREVLLTDTVGFVRELPHHLVASFHATLEETLQADLLLHVCDSSDPDLDSHIRAVEQVLASLGADGIARVLVMNKVDRIEESDRAALQITHPDALFVSARNGYGIAGLEEALADRLDAWSLHLELQVPAGAGRVLASLRRNTHVEAEEFQGEDWVARVRVLPDRWGPLGREVQDSGGSYRPVTV